MRPVETFTPRTRKREITPLEEQARICNIEADYNPHDPIDSQKQEKGVSAFCGLLRGKGGYLEPGMVSQRVEFQDDNGGRHHYKVEWTAGCLTEVESQAIRRPLGHLSASPNCDDLMRDNYLKCNNGGVGGKVQIGCLIYTYNGGIMAGREYDW
ncbi:glycoside hydrolase family 18 protein [Colletotrichum tofieldiae]|uniref:Glycoside hydrolase family 18 protein n=1 Tax=Colletotrichum tofieldiae TaxID=708197 RepID=A0A161YGN3_9PEZI|nr:glycoside hydrolase family 18 protein [Colletotrichum tofieldiae]GKT54751.1 glycoside hydrolase family 18 protein [Colletotrichum tofieldiae]GKT75968.1 glycoside hydrolase family 18 protein [Colletotrichum tofieldiae]GKT83678.1 glycoside hydrolase family 18 protein [Colletotrichum tofieldiae]